LHIICCLSCDERSLKWLQYSKEVSGLAGTTGVMNAGATIRSGVSI
jgi:hypothetical protein